jgi:hypothetical protein
VNYIETADAHGSAAGAHGGGNNAQGSSFPRSVGAKQAKDFTVTRSEGDIIHCCKLSKAFAQFLDFDHGCFLFRLGQKVLFISGEI